MCGHSLSVPNMNGASLLHRHSRARALERILHVLVSTHLLSLFMAAETSSVRVESFGA
jgi:hypothetical protein